MDTDRQDLIRHLFALATEIVEGLHETAVAGQAGNVATAESAAAAVSLCRRADDLKALGQTVLIALEHAETEAAE